MPASSKNSSLVGQSDSGYLFEEKLGEGGFGAVYRVSREGKAPVALKVLLADHMANTQVLRRFEREIETIQRIDHPSCIGIYDSGCLRDGSPYFTMELLEGRDLFQEIRRVGAMSIETVLSILAPVCEALQVAHTQSIIHRDIKASNVFLCSDGRVKLLDFGIAKFFDTPGMTLTLSRQHIGTPSAMAPEQLVRGGNVDARTDVYALGALAYSMLTGIKPFTASSLTMLQHLHRHAARPRPSARVRVSTAIDRVIVSAMSVDASRRPPDAITFLEELQMADSGRSEPESKDSAFVMAVYGFLGPCSDDAALVQKELAAIDAALVVLSSLGFSLLSLQSRGFVCTRKSSEWVPPSFEPLREIRKVFAGSAPGAKLTWKLGDVECRSGLPWSGDTLIP